MAKDIEEIFEQEEIPKDDIIGRIELLIEELALPYVVVENREYSLKEINDIPKKELSALYERLCEEYNAIRNIKNKR